MPEETSSAASWMRPASGTDTSPDVTEPAQPSRWVRMQGSSARTAGSPGGPAMRVRLTRRAPRGPEALLVGRAALHPPIDMPRAPRRGHLQGRSTYSASCVSESQQSSPFQSGKLQEGVTRTRVIGSKLLEFAWLHRPLWIRRVWFELRRGNSKPGNEMESLPGFAYLRGETLRCSNLSSELRKRGGGSSIILA